MSAAVHERMEAALERLAAGGLILVQDDAGRENEGDLVGAAELVTPDMINFMATKGRGLICQAITTEMARQLQLPLQWPGGGDSMGTAFTVSVDAAEGITTGISAADRARTAAVLTHPEARPEDLLRPGHLFPLIARDGGVLERRGHTEAAVELARLAGLRPSGLICEVLSSDGSMARGPELRALARDWEMPLISVADLVAWRQHEASSDPDIWSGRAAG